MTPGVGYHGPMPPSRQPVSRQPASIPVRRTRASAAGPNSTGPSRSTYRRRRIVVGAALVVTLAAGFYVPTTLLAPVPIATADVEAYEPPPVVQPTITFPPYGAAGVGAIGYPGVLAGAGSADPLPIASITKIVTALVVLGEKPLQPGEPGPEVTFGEVDEDFYDAQLAAGGSVEPAFAGQVITERDMLSVMLMASANNYAESLASWAFGSQDAYLAAAATWLADAGLASTTIVDPSGVSPANTSTVADLIELARRVQASPVVAEIVATVSVEVPELGLIENRNALLGVDGVDGIKTGTLDEAGSCLLFSQDHPVGSQVVTVIGVVLGGPDHDTIDAAIRSLLAEVDAGFSEVPLVAAGEEFARYDTPWGDDATAVASDGLSVVAWSAAPISAEVEVEPVRLQDAGTTVGRVRFTVGDDQFEVPLELSATIDDPGPAWRISHPGELF